jgi:3-deoxy-D-manno-octulosonate 8-phosphate phosphatase (KDO 8-P phosphatase)
VIEQTTRPTPGNTPKTRGFGLISHSLLEAKGFHGHDGTAISLARSAGIRTGLITKHIAETVAIRACDLKLDHIDQGIHDKLTALREILTKEKLHTNEAASIGDEVIDLPVMWNCGAGHGCRQRTG